MKRTKPLRRTGFKKQSPIDYRQKKPRRKGLKQESAPHRKKRLAADPERKAYKELFGWCQYPGCRRSATETHEIVRGTARMNAYGKRACSLNLCREHHVKVQPWPLAVQCRLKQYADPEGYDAEQIRTAKRGKAIRESAKIFEDEEVSAVDLEEWL